MNELIGAATDILLPLLSGGAGGVVGGAAGAAGQELYDHARDLVLRAGLSTKEPAASETVAKALEEAMESGLVDDHDLHRLGELHAAASARAGNVTIQGGVKVKGSVGVMSIGSTHLGDVHVKD